MGRVEVDAVGLQIRVNKKCMNKEGMHDLFRDNYVIFV